MTSFLKAMAPIWKPHPGQTAFLKSNSPIKVLACGRRWGKTDACAAEVIRSLTTKPDGKHLLIAPTLDQATILFDRVVELLDSLKEIWPFGSQIPEMSIRRTPYPKLRFGDHQLSARSGHVGRSLRGNEANHIVIDEAAFVPEELITEIAMPMLATTKGTLTMISTPRGMNHFWRFFRMGQEGRNRVWSRTAHSAESPFVSKSFLETQRDLISERAYRIEYEAEFCDSEGRVFRTETIERALVPSMDRKTDAPICIGIDWARYTDYSAVTVVAGHRNDAQLWETDRFHGLAWAQQIERVGRILERFPNASVFCDATGIGDPLLEMLRDRFTTYSITGTTFTASSKALLIDRLAWMFENDALVMEPQPDLMRELQHFESKVSSSGNTKLAAAQGFHDDLIMSLSLACQGWRQSYFPAIQLGGEREFSKNRKKRNQRIEIENSKRKN